MSPLFSGAIILAGGMTRDRADALLADGTIDLAAFGQPFIGNPDLVDRLRERHPLTIPDKATFYGGDAHGYTDYPTYPRPDGASAPSFDPATGTDHA